MQIASYFRVSVDYLVGNEEYNGTNIKITKKDIELINLLKDNPVVYKELMSDMNGWIFKLKMIIREQKL